MKYIGMIYSPNGDLAAKNPAKNRFSGEEFIRNGSFVTMRHLFDDVCSYDHIHFTRISEGWISQWKIFELLVIQACYSLRREQLSYLFQNNSCCLNGFDEMIQFRDGRYLQIGSKNCLQFQRSQRLLAWS